MNEESPTPRRFEGFAKFFKRYMSVSSLVTASLPVPVTMLGLIPTYKTQSGFLSTYTSLFCFLTLGFIFYSRHGLARIMFAKYLKSSGARLTPRMSRWHTFFAALPLALIISSLICILAYHAVLNASISRRLEPYKTLGATYESLDTLNLGGLKIKEFEEKREEIKETLDQMTEDLSQLLKKYGSLDKFVLATTSQNQIEYAWLLIALYLVSFLSATAAFLLMATKEYLQDVIGISEIFLIVPEETKDGLTKA